MPPKVWDLKTQTNDSRELVFGSALTLNLPYILKSSILPVDWFIVSLVCCFLGFSWLIVSLVCCFLGFSSRATALLREVLGSRGRAICDGRTESDLLAFFRQADTDGDGVLSVRH